MSYETLEFDIIVVGAGRAGCVVAGRLSEITGLKIALVEGGKKDHLRLAKIPAAVLKTLGHPRYDYRFKTEPDPTRNGRIDQIAPGKLLGGSSGRCHIVRTASILMARGNSGQHSGRGSTA